MSYSRRQLYALGETLGECVTRRKADGGLILGGGSSPAPSSPTQTTTGIQELPSWARPYAQTTLEKASALTSQPYVPYTENRIAGFSPLQQQAQQQAANMAPAEQLGQGSALAGTAGLGGLGVANQATVGGFQNQVGGYMNPYLQYALAPQIAEANRQYDITGTKQQGAATQAGAFGGSREAIMAAENERNRNMGIQNIVGQGYNTAFNQAQNQYNQNLGNQLQGYGMAGQAAGQLGQLGQTQYGQQMGINQLQNQYGAQQQQLQQQGLTQAYQDFLNQQNYPYKQLGFMSDIIRGLPLGQQSASNVYQGAGSPLGQIAGLGAGLAGASKLFAGGGGVESSGNIAGILSKLSDEQLKQAKQAALSRQDVEEADLIDQEMAHRTSMRQGVNAAPVDADQMASDENPESITGYATGGSAVADLMAKPKETEQSVKDIITEQSGMLEEKNKPLLQSLQADVEAQKGRPEEIKGRGLNDALAQFGFAMAANAAKPGARFLGSAAAASPVIAESAMNTQKAIQAAQDKYNDLRATQTKYQIALNQGNMHDAIQQANIMRQEKQQQKLLELNAAHFQDQYNLGLKQVAAAAGAHVAPFMQLVNDLAADPRNKDKSREELMTMASKAMYGAQYAGSEQRGTAAYLKDKNDIEKDYKTLPFLPPNSPMRQQMESERQRRLDDLNKLYPGAAAQGGAPSGSISSALPQSGTQRTSAPSLQQSDLDLINRYSR